MQPESRKGQISVAWNGLQLKIPKNWDLRIGGHRNLIFEKNLQPQWQLRWAEGSRGSSKAVEAGLPALTDKLGSPMREPPAAWRRLKRTFNHLTCYQHENGNLGGGACICPQCSTILSFQLLTDDPEVVGLAAESFASLSCHSGRQTVWRMQDFSLVTPPSFTLTDYTFGAGLTRLSFRQADLILHTCRLASADERLTSQTLEEILLILADVVEFDLTRNDDFTSQGYRRPSISRQIMLRLRREKPFVWAKLWHDSNSNRLLGVVLQSNRPIPDTTATTICESYEIVT